MTGQITDAIGAGQKDVAVTVYCRQADGSRGEKIGETTTDAMGDFRITASEAIRGESLIVFTKPQFTDLVREVRLGESDRPPFVGDMLHGNLALEGRVLSAVGQRPISGARVVFQGVAFERETLSSEEGEFEISGLSPGDGELVVMASGFGRERINVRVPTPDDAVVHLKPERIIHLQVVDDLGNAIRGVTVECLDAPRGDFRTVVTGPDGRVDIGGLHFDASTPVLLLTHEGHVSTNGPGERINLPLLEMESQYRMVLQRAGTIAGRITDAQSRDPVYGARVFAGESYSDYAPRVWSDVVGEFSLSGVRPGSAVVTVHRAGFAPDMKSVEVRPAETAHLDFALGEPATLRGQIRNQKDQPIAGAEVAAVRWRNHETLGLRTMTDGDGRFVIDDAPGDEFEISIFAAGASPYVQMVSAGGGPLAITLRAGDPARSVSGTAPLKPGDVVPNVSLKTLDGRSFTLAEMKGKTVLVVFWATWCGPCVGEVPSLVEAFEKFRGRKDFVMIGVSRDFEESALRNFLNANPKAAWPQAFGEDGGVPAAVEAFGVWSVPAIFLIGPDGRIVAADLRGEETVQEIERTLKGKAP